MRTCVWKFCADNSSFKKCDNNYPTTVRSERCAVFPIIGFFLSFAFFADENYRTAIKTLSTLELFLGAAQFEGRELKLRYLLLLCHFELGHSDTVLQQINSMGRKARRFGNPLKSEELVLNFYQEALNLDTSKLKKQMRRVVSSLKTMEEYPLENIFTDFFYFLITWMKSKINEKTFQAEWKTFTTQKLKNNSKLSPW